MGGSLRFKDEKHKDSNASSHKHRKHSDHSHKSSKRRRRHSSTPPVFQDSDRRAFTPEPEALDEPITPPRGGYKRTHYTLERESDFVDLPPQSTKYETDAEFNERLFEAMREDEPAEDDLYYVPDRWRTTAATNVNSRGATITSIQLPQGHSVNGLTDEEYAEYMRNGMWRKSHAEALKAAEERDKARAQREKEARERRERARREEAERLRKLAQAKTQKQKEHIEAEREAYRQKWTALQASPKDAQLSYADFPWPLNASSGSVSKKAISDFLFASTSAEDDVEDQVDEKLRKQALRAAVLAYHPDRFDRFVQRVPEKHDQREQVRAMGLRVSQILNELLGEL